ncbi:MAG TPA: YlaI family protein [Bacillota bacterium]|nr:YlaI family protein [Bacillota bacterium]
MQTKCTLCEHTETIDKHSFKAKRLRNKRISLYLCDACDERITKRTNERIETGNFKLFKCKNNKSILQ